MLLIIVIFTFNGVLPLEKFGTLLTKNLEPLQRTVPSSRAPTLVLDFPLYPFTVPDPRFRREEGRGRDERSLMKTENPDPRPVLLYPLGG